MHVEIIEALRCPADHPEGWLVAVPARRDARGIADGTLGCPTCGREWLIEDGRLRLAEAEGRAPEPAGARGATVHTDAAAHATPPAATHATPHVATHATTDADALRLAALLDLRTAGGLVLLGGDAARCADALVALTGILVLAVNAPPGAAHAHARLDTDAILPLGVGTLRGAVLDGHTAPLLDGVVRAVARGGRIVAPVTTDATRHRAALHELARDEWSWVAEVRTAASGLVALRRAEGAP